MTSKQRFTVIPAVYLVLIKDNKVLLLRRLNTGYRDGWYSLPAGHIDGGEPAIRAMVREAKEEVGLNLEESDLRFVHLRHYAAEGMDGEYFALFFQADKWRGEPKNMEPNKCDELCWADLDDLPDNIIPAVASSLECIKNNIAYSDQDF